MSDVKSSGGFIDVIRQPTMIFAIFLITIVLMLIIPLPAFLLDLLSILSK